MNTHGWPFVDSPNVAVFTDKRVTDGQTWIYYVGHDADAGAWQFHGPAGFASEASARVVSLKTILSLDGTIAGLANLPLGWCAWRETPDSDWQRYPQQ